jgi:hypothetical protein
VVDAVVGAYTTAENTLAGGLIDRLTPGMSLSVILVVAALS